MKKLSVFAILLVAAISYSKGCRDKDRRCRQFASYGYCSNPRYSNYMRTQCKKSCNLCRKKKGHRVGGYCRDMQTSCGYWARTGECTKNPTYMKKYCCKSCAGRTSTPVHGGFTSWARWGPCSTTCGDGKQERTRSCTNPRPKNGGRKCSGSSTETKKCNIAACAVKPPPPVPPPVAGDCVDNKDHAKNCGGWKSLKFCQPGNEYYEFMKENCKKTCGFCTGGNKCATKNGGCEQLCAVKNGDVKCSCKDDYIINPDFKTCSKVVHGGFGKWSKWSKCTKTCGKGTEHRTRKCDSPKPQNGGRDCVGLKKESRFCNTDDCPTGVVPPPMPNSCVDKYGDTCKLWPKKYCVEGHQFYPFMMAQCRKSCDACSSDKCQAANGGCAQVCKNDVQKKKAVCSCNSGFILNPDMKTCTKVKTTQKGCGKIKDYIELGRVIDGQDAFPFKWIWQGGLYYFEEYTCGGALIAPDLFLTAAHCVTGGQSEEGMVIRMGDWNRIKDEEYEQEIEVQKILAHEEWDWGTVHNDIALLKLKQEFKLNDQVGLVCLPKKNYEPPKDAKCYITGWGRTSAEGDPAEKLQEAELPIVPNAICGKRNVGRDGKSRIVDSMVCGGFQDKNTKVSGCRGDSGGPYVCKNGDKWELQGVVSWGSSKCDVQQKYTVFTRVAKYIDWITAKAEEASQ